MMLYDTEGPDFHSSATWLLFKTFNLQLADSNNIQYAFFPLNYAYYSGILIYMLKAERLTEAFCS